MHKKTTEMIAVSQLFRNFAPANVNERVHQKKWILFKLNNSLGQLYSALGINNSSK